MIEKIYGEAAIQHPDTGEWSHWAASYDGTTLMCYDLAGFMGHWEVKKPYMFFPSETAGSTLCHTAIAKAAEYCKTKNEGSGE